MIGTWALVIFNFCVWIACIIVFIKARREHETGIAIAMICTFIITAFISGYAVWHLYGTESGKRAQRDFKSETQAGYTERTLDVYDIKGEKIAHYEGKFDTQENYDSGLLKVKFDNDGKRTIIYSMTGTVIINDK